MQGTRAPVAKASSIAPADGADFGKILAIAGEKLIADHPRILRWFEAHRPEFLTDARPIWAATQKGQVVGFLVSRFDKPDDAKCSVLYVDEAHRGAGIGSDLLRAFEEKAILHGCKTTHLVVYADQERAQEFFSDRGYQPLMESRSMIENPNRKRKMMFKTLRTG